MSINATVYDKETGKILKTIMVGRSSDLLLNISEDSNYIIGSYAPDKYYIEDNSAFEFVEKPDYPVIFNWELKNWEWDEETTWANLRKERNRLLTACDWTQIPDATANKEAWLDYREKLRDLPNSTVDPRYPDWPTPPL